MSFILFQRIIKVYNKPSDIFLRKPVFTGVALEFNLRNPLHTGDETHPGFEARGWHQSPKGITVAGLMPSKTHFLNGNTCRLEPEAELPED